AASPLKPAVDEAVEQTPSVRNVLVVRRTGGEVQWVEEGPRGRRHVRALPERWPEPADVPAQVRRVVRLGGSSCPALE
ncbi:MAG TPA: hypothetical protein VLQ92_13365, partial [Candidatus Limnocylindrales bacterium]|nr:hypothetical protein [Candidatus Limnocylindrales bacterium]